MIDSKEAFDLMDADRTAELLGRVTPAEAGQAWCGYAERAVAMDEHPDWEDDPDGWAAQLLMELTDRPVGDAGLGSAGEEFLRSFLATIAEAAPNDRVLSWIGAGPIEDFLSEDESRLQWVEQEASRSEDFRLALAGIWIEDFGPDVFLRVPAAAQTELVWHIPCGPRPMPDGSFADPELHRNMT